MTVATAAGAGGAVTVSPALPVLVSLVAVIVADPAATAVTNPLDETVAIIVLLLDHVTTRPMSTLLLTSRVTAVACVVCPVCSDDDARATVTVATAAGGGGAGGDVTVNPTLPVFVSLVAVIVADPAATAVTIPFDDTVATPLLLLDQVTTRPVSTFPFTSRVTAVACVV